MMVDSGPEDWLRWWIVGLKLVMMADDRPEDWL
jgi:hypothetical protein